MSGFSAYAPALTQAAGLYASHSGSRRDAAFQSQLADYNAQVLANNARFNSQMAAMSAQLMNDVAGSIMAYGEAGAQMARDAATIEANRQRRFAKRLASTQRQAYAGSGVGFEGTPLLVMADTARESEYDALLLEYQGEVNAWNTLASAASNAAGYRVQGAMAIQNSRLAEYAATQEAAGLRWGASIQSADQKRGAGAALLQGASQWAITYAPLFTPKSQMGVIQGSPGGGTGR